MSGTRERRQARRVRVALEVNYRSADTFLFAYITDLSLLGIFIHTETPSPPGTQLTLRFTPPGHSAPMDLEGQVMWINPVRMVQEGGRSPGMGIRFRNVTEQQRERLVDLVRTVAYLPDEADDDENAPS
jgi:type IV pilus assembly protein PilZ